MTTAIETINVNCNRCGAPLRIAGGTRFAACSYCGAQLQVHVEGGAAYTEVLEKIDTQTQQIAQDVREIKQHELLEKLDREWTQSHRSSKPGSPNGVNRPLGIIASLLPGAAGVAFGIFWITIIHIGQNAIPRDGFSSPLPGHDGTIYSIMDAMQILFTLVGVVIIFTSVGAAVYAVNRANKYAAAERSYLSERQKLTDSID